MCINRTGTNANSVLRVVQTRSRQHSYGRVGATDPRTDCPDGQSGFSKGGSRYLLQSLVFFSGSVTYKYSDRVDQEDIYSLTSTAVHVPIFFLFNRPSLASLASLSMDFPFAFVLSLIFMCQAVDVAMALPIPPSFRRAPLLEAPGTLVLEMGFYSIFTMGKRPCASTYPPRIPNVLSAWTALLFSLLGAYMMKVMGGTRTPAFMARLPRTSKHPSPPTLSHCQILPYRRCLATPDHQPSPLPSVGSRQPRHSAPPPRSPGKNVRTDGDGTSPLGSAFDSSCPSSMTVTCGLWSVARDALPDDYVLRFALHVLCYLFFALFSSSYVPWW